MPKLCRKPLTFTLIVLAGLVASPTSAVLAGAVEAGQFLVNVNTAAIDNLISGVMRSQARIAKPRLLTRVVVHELERARQDGEAYSAPENADQLVRDTAKQIATAADL